ncbi:MAG TPA: hypothetical protein VN830_08630 [Verrucomicrobiae bacterium]|nr:hypothetical protein [Verrucomicrobiae bacterium]
MPVDCSAWRTRRRAGGASLQFDLETARELGYPANSKHEQVAGHSDRSGKIRGVGVPAGGGAALDATVGNGLADGWNGLL